MLNCFVPAVINSAQRLADKPCLMHYHVTRQLLCNIIARHTLLDGVRFIAKSKRTGRGSITTVCDLVAQARNSLVIK